MVSLESKLDLEKDLSLELMLFELEVYVNELLKVDESESEISSDIWFLTSGLSVCPSGRLSVCITVCSVVCRLGRLGAFSYISSRKIPSVKNGLRLLLRLILLNR